MWPFRWAEAWYVFLGTGLKFCGRSTLGSGRCTHPGSPARARVHGLLELAGHAERAVRRPVTDGPDLNVRVRLLQHRVWSLRNRTFGVVGSC